MKKRLVYLMLCFATVSTFAQEYLWEEAVFAHTNNSGSKIYRMAMSNSDEKVVLGYYRDSLNIASETITTTKPIGVFLAKYDSGDSLLWVKNITEAEEYTPVTYSTVLSNTPIVKIDNLGNIYIGLNYNATLIDDSIPLLFDENCSFCSDFLVIKLDSDGNQLISVTVENTCSTNIDFDGIVIDEQQNVYVSGFAFNSPNIPDPLPICECVVGEDTLFVEEGLPFLAKFNSNGQGLWQTSDIGTATIIEMVGNFIYVAGISVKSNISFGDYTLNFPSSYDYSGYIAKFDTSGVFYWAKYFGVTGWDSNIQVYDLQAISENNIVLTARSFTQSVPNKVYVQGASTLNGDTWGGRDYFIINYDSLGNVHWHDIADCTSDDYFLRLTHDHQKNIYAVGKFGGILYFGEDTLNSYGSEDVLICSYDSLGSKRWAKHIGGTGLDLSAGIEIDQSNNLYVLGSTASSNFYLDNLTYSLDNSFTQMFLAKLKLSGLEIPEQVQPLSIELYPNPNTGTFRLKSEQPIQQVELYSVLGEQVYSKQYNKATTQVEINTKLATGIYFVLLQTEQGALHAKKMRVE